MKCYFKIIIFFLIQSLLCIGPSGILIKSFPECLAENFEDKLSPVIQLNSDEIKQVFLLSNFSDIVVLSEEKIELQRITDLFYKIIDIARSKYGLDSKILAKISPDGLADKITGIFASGSTYKSQGTQIIKIYNTILKRNDTELAKVIGHEVAHIIYKDYRFKTLFMIGFIVGVIIYFGSILNIVPASISSAVNGYIVILLMTLNEFFLEPNADYLGEKLAQEAGLILAEQKKGLDDAPMRYKILLRSIDRNNLPQTRSKEKMADIVFEFNFKSLKAYQQFSQVSFSQLLQAI